jgi:hypothetical protein
MLFAELKRGRALWVLAMLDTCRWGDVLKLFEGSLSSLEGITSECCYILRFWRCWRRCDINLSLIKST